MRNPVGSWDLTVRQVWQLTAEPAVPEVPSEFQDRPASQWAPDESPAPVQLFYMD